MLETPDKMHMYDMVKIDKIFFEIVGGGGLLKPPPPRIANCLKYPESDRVNKLSMLIVLIQVLQKESFDINMEYPYNHIIIMSISNAPNNFHKLIFSVAKNNITDCISIVI